MPILGCRRDTARNVFQWYGDPVEDQCALSVVPVYSLQEQPIVAEYQFVNVFRYQQMCGHVQFLYREPKSNLTQDRYLGLVRGGDSDGGRLHLSCRYQLPGYFAVVTTRVQMAFILIAPNVRFHVGVGPCYLPCDDVQFQVSYVLSCCRCIRLRLSFLSLRRKSSPVSELVVVVADGALGGFVRLLLQPHVMVGFEEEYFGWQLADQQSHDPELL